MRKVAGPALINYPFIFSAQLLLMLSTYVFVYIAKETISMRIPHISMMIILAIP